MNTVALMGRLTFEPELKSTQSGNSFIRFTIAVDRTYQAKGKDREADFVDCLAWGNTAEFISRYFHKGSMIAVEGSLQTSTYEKDGQKRKSVEVVVKNASFCGDKVKADAPEDKTDDSAELPW